MDLKSKMLKQINLASDKVMKSVDDACFITDANKKKKLITLYNEDCLTKLGDIEENSVDLVITDPPYFLDGLGNKWDSYKIRERTKKASVVRGLPVGMKFDKRQGIQFQSFYSLVSKHLFKVLKPGGFFLSFSQPRLYHRMAVAVEDVGFEIRDQYVWHYTKKSQFKAFSQNHFVNRKKWTKEEKQLVLEKLDNRKTPQLRPQFESILMAQKPKEGTHIENWLKWETGLIDASQTLNGKVASTVMTVEKPIKDKYNCHLTVKPTRIIEHLIRLFSIKGQHVLDPFMGSGTTGLACKKTERLFTGIEVNKEYMKIAKLRMRCNK